jgi:hypothetical protein
MTYEQETLWLAGLLEGEGSFTAHGRSPTVRLKMADEDVVQRAAVIMGGKFRTVPRYNEPAHWKSKFEVYVCGDRAVHVMQRILPFMGFRRKQKIEERLEAASHRWTTKEVSDNARKKRAENQRLKVVA